MLLFLHHKLVKLLKTECEYVSLSLLKTCNGVCVVLYCELVLCHCTYTMPCLFGCKLHMFLNLLGVLYLLDIALKTFSKCSHLIASNLVWQENNVVK